MNRIQVTPGAPMALVLSVGDEASDSRSTNGSYCNVYRTVFISVAGHDN